MLFPVLALRTPRLIILESDLSIRKMLRRLLERRGYLTIETSQVEEVSALLRDRRADLLIVDLSASNQVNMPCVLSIARAYPNLKILAISSEPLEEQIPGRLQVLPKPFALDSLLNGVTRLLQ